MLVSILIPVYNSEDYLEEAIKSAINQTWEEKEIIIIDDGSTDSSLELAKKYEGPQVKIFQQENKGAPSARNLAFAKSSGTYIQYLDADDYMDPDKIEKQLEVLSMSQYQKDTIVFCPHYRIKGERVTEYSNSLCFKSYQPGYEILIDFWRISFPSIPSHSYLCHRDLIKESGDWDMSLQKNQDCDFFAKILEKCDKLVYCDNTYVYYRDVPNSISKPNTLEKVKSELAVNKSITKIILSKTQSENAIQACSLRYTEFIESNYPLNKKLIGDAIRDMKEYGLSFSTEGRGSIFTLLPKIFNWRQSIIIYSIYKRMKSFRLVTFFYKKYR